MKKTQKTMITSAILSMAAATVAIVPDANAIQTDTSSAMAPVYGPPPSYTQINGDVNDDGKVNIIDACLIKSESEDNSSIGTDMTYDVNKDGVVNSLDFLSVRNYFLGITPDLTMPVVTQPVYGTMPIVTTPPKIVVTQPAYGTMPVVTTETEPVVTSVTQNEDVNSPSVPTTPAITTPAMTTVYGPPSIFAD